MTLNLRHDVKIKLCWIQQFSRYCCVHINAKLVWFNRNLNAVNSKNVVFQPLSIIECEGLCVILFKSLSTKQYYIKYLKTDCYFGITKMEITKEFTWKISWKIWEVLSVRVDNPFYHRWWKSSINMISSSFVHEFIWPDLGLETYVINLINPYWNQNFVWVHRIQELTIP